MTAAALGTTLALPTLEADVVPPEGATTDLETTVDLEIRPGTQSGTEQVLRGRGVPGLRGGRGNLVVHDRGRDAGPADARQEELLRELAAIRGEEQPDARRARRAARRSSAGSATRSTRSTDPARMSRHVHLVPSLEGVGVGSTVTVDGDEAHHAVAVRRVRVGESVLLTDGRGTTARRRGDRDRQADLDVTVTAVESVPRPEPRLVVVQACPRATAASSRSRC